MPKEIFLFYMPEDAGKRKTKIISVYSARHGDRLGTIKWYSGWRQYAFFPQPETIWNRDCLIEIENKINELMFERKSNPV